MIPERDRGGRREFERAMEEVAPLAEGPSRVVGRRRRTPARRARPLPPAAGFEIETRGEHMEGLARGADPRQLARLRTGAIPVDLRLDLHGLGAEAARETVLEALDRAAIHRWRALLVVHGRGRRSPDGPVLKRALPGWLAAAPRVLGFTSADPARGGPGATLVLLRRKRSTREEG